MGCKTCNFWWWNNRASEHVFAVTEKPIIFNANIIYDFFKLLASCLYFFPQKLPNSIVWKQQRDFKWPQRLDNISILGQGTLIPGSLGPLNFWWLQTKAEGSCFRNRILLTYQINWKVFFTALKKRLITMLGSFLLRGRSANTGNSFFRELSRRLIFFENYLLCLCSALIRAFFSSSGLDRTLLSSRRWSRQFKLVPDSCWGSINRGSFIFTWRSF